MAKTASTKSIIELLQEFEAIYGVGSLRSIGTVCSGDRTVEYILHVTDKNGNEHSIEVPSVNEKTIFAN